MPIWYDEFGVESLIPAAKAALYTGTEPTTTKPVDEATQAAYYQQAVQLVVLPAERPRALPLPHGRREGPRPPGSPGVYYADDTPKASLTAVRTALDAVAPRRRHALRRAGADREAKSRR